MSLATHHRSVEFGAVSGAVLAADEIVGALPGTGAFLVGCKTVRNVLPEVCEAVPELH